MDDDDDGSEPPAVATPEGDTNTNNSTDNYEDDLEAAIGSPCFFEPYLRQAIHSRWW